MKPNLIFSLLLLTILLAQPGAARACNYVPKEGMTKTKGGDYVYALGDRVFSLSEKNEYLFQRWPNIVIARLTRILDAEGDTYPWNKGTRLLPNTFHFDVVKSFKGDLGPVIQAEAIRSSEFSSCNRELELQREYLLFLPETPETGKFKHFDITIETNPSRDVKHYADLIAWLEERAGRDQAPPSTDQPEETSPP